MLPSPLFHIVSGPNAQNVHNLALVGDTETALWQASGCSLQHLCPVMGNNELSAGATITSVG